MGLFVGVVTFTSFGVYLVGQMRELRHEGHVLPETHSEYAVTLPDAPPSFQVSSGVAGGAGAGLWNHGLWNHGLWGD